MVSSLNLLTEKIRSKGHNRIELTPLRSHVQMFLTKKGFAHYEQE